jgi:RHS repeat-associated protein
MNYENYIFSNRQAIISDLWGNRLSINEPNAGMIKSTYNGFNELTKQIDARNDTTTYQYDNVGRVTYKRYASPEQGVPSQTITYLYDTYAATNRGRGKISQIKINNSIDPEEEFTYDNLSRLAKHSKAGCGKFEYTYTPIHTDHLGSYCAITNSKKQVRQRNWFDPWGNPKDDLLQASFALTNRGFTGHEHYQFFKIINMNGRLYDPVIGRFFSPDTYV